MIKLYIYRERMLMNSYAYIYRMLMNECNAYVLIFVLIYI